MARTAARSSAARPRVNVDQLMRRAEAHQRGGETEHARALYETILQDFPQNARARAALVRLAGGGRPIAELLAPALAALAAEDFATAADEAGALLAQHPDCAALHNIRGVAAFRLGDLEAAEAALSRALKLAPRDASAQSNLGAVLRAQGRNGAAIAAYRAALEIAPEHLDALFNLGNALMAEGAAGEAAALFCRARALAPGRGEIVLNLGNALWAEGQMDAALEAWRAVPPVPAQTHAMACNQMGTALVALGRFDEALAACRAALATAPDLAEAHFNLGVALRESGAHQAALESFARYRVLRPDDSAARALCAMFRREICDWSQPAEDAAALGPVPPEAPAVTPFVTLSLCDDPAYQQARSGHWARQSFAPAPPPLPARARAADAPLRIGYFGADFFDHATLYLMAGLLREHDRSRFDIHLYSYGRQKEGRMRAQAQDLATRFHDVQAMSSGAIVDLARDEGLDIAIDLKGHTKHTRLEPFRARLAAVQISYLGYPGTLGCDFIDYIVADAALIPPAERSFYTERVIWMPHSYQPNDDRRVIAPLTRSRADCGLPETGVVFCCFNNAYKITPAEFAIWMRLLAGVEGSVLWLIASNDAAQLNLRRHAAAQGVDPERIVFAEPLVHAEHLARLAHADLFLDTFNYNAHTTASDALWAGVPVLTKAGRQFAARVGASLLGAAGLAELITETGAEYEALALALARDPARLGALRARLAREKRGLPLFDSAGYARDFEAALCEAHALAVAGAPPRDINFAR